MEKKIKQFLADKFAENWIKNNKDFQSKLRSNNLDKLSLKKEKKIYKDYTKKDLQDSFCLSFDEALAHENVKYDRNDRPYLQQHYLLIRNNKS